VSVEELDDPHIVITIVDRQGLICAKSIRTDAMNNGPKNDSRTRRRSLLFKLPYNQPQEQTSISDIVFLCPPQDTQVDDDEYKVFFELKHWKVQSEKFSTKCFSFMVQSGKYGNNATVSTV